MKEIIKNSSRTNSQNEVSSLLMAIPERSKE
jgi:hypothetical protein